jgi:hypothetical protein
MAGMMADVAILVPFAFAKRLEEKRLPAQRGCANG